MLLSLDSAMSHKTLTYLVLLPLPPQRSFYLHISPFSFKMHSLPSHHNLNFNNLYLHITTSTLTLQPLPSHHKLYFHMTLYLQLAPFTFT